MIPKHLQQQCLRASSFPEMAMPPKDAYEALVANDVTFSTWVVHE